MAKLSVIIICKDEAKDIADCLRSVTFADEIIVLDSGSSDNTVAICRQYTSHVFETDWPGFGRQKNRAREHASGDWILSIDADERVSDELQQEILKAIHETTEDGFYIPRVSTYCGRVIRYGTWAGDKVLRLFRASKGVFTDDAVHERVIVQGSVGNLNCALTHLSFRDFSEVLHKMDHYSTLAAEMRFEQGKRGSVFKALGHGMWSFFRSYFLKLGFLDGAEGLMLAISNAEGSYYRYVKLWLMQK